MKPFHHNYFKKRLFVVVFFLTVLIKSNAQAFTYQTLILKGHYILSKQDRDQLFYRFQEFQKASIEFLGGYKPSHDLLLNLNLYLERIEVIGENGDTTNLPYLAEMSILKIDKHLFFYDYHYTKGYVEKLNQGTVSLGAKYNFSLSADGRTPLTKYTDWRSPIWPEDRYYTRWETYFFVDKNNLLYKATRPSILKLIPNSKRETKRFIRKNKIDFKAKDDLFKLLEFCNQSEEDGHSAKR